MRSGPVTEVIMDLSTTLMGLRLPHPFIAGASPLGRDLDSIKRLEDAGCAAIVLPSLFEEQITLATEGRVRHLDPHSERSATRLAGFPTAEHYALSPDKYAEHVAKAKRSVHVPVIGSLNGTTSESWLKYSQLIEQAGADALELNMYEVVTDLRASAHAIEHTLIHTVADLKTLLKIPIAVKLSPFFTAAGNLAQQLDRAGADALVLFNRFYQPDIDIETMSAVPQPELSTSAELPLRLRWLAILHGHVKASLVATGGIATAADGVKALLAGADALQIVSAILRNGPEYFLVLRKGLEEWMERHQMTHVDEVRGRLSLKHVADPASFERGHYIRTLHGWKASA
jgi:dihydroorotate dehydrogenase (fumarate)